MSQSPDDRHPLRDDNNDDWDDLDTITGKATPQSDTPFKDRPKPSPRAPLPPAKYSWSEVWTAALMRPNLATFQELLTDPRADGRRAYLWVFLTLIVTIFVTLTAFFSDPAFMEIFVTTSPDFEAVESSFITMTMLIAVPITAGMGIFVFMAFVWGVNYTAGRVANLPQPAPKERMGQLAFVLSASLAPLNLISALLVIVSIPLVGFILTVYQIYLMTLASQAVFGITTREATMSILFPIGGLLLLQLFMLGGLF